MLELGRPVARRQDGSGADGASSGCAIYSDAGPPPLSPDPTRHTYVGIFFVALATLMYEILLTRIFSVTMLYHFAFVALSIAMFGMTAGALIVYLAPSFFSPRLLPYRLAASAVLFPVAIVLSFMTELSIPFRVQTSVIELYAIAFTYVVIAIPFVVSGVVICLVLTGFPRRVSRLYAADLAGGALGCVLLVGVIGWSDGPTAVLWVAFFASIGGVAFALDGQSAALRRASVIGLVVLGVAAAGHTVLVRRGSPIFRIVYSKGLVETRPVYEKWNSYSRVRVMGNPDVELPAQGWGLSSQAPKTRLRQLHLDIDAWAGTTMTKYDGDLAPLEHLKYDVTNVAYYLRRDHSALVIGAGGGRDVLSALAFGARSVTAVEINKDILRTVNGRFGDFTGHLDRDPRVRFVNDEARSFVARSPDRFDTIQISLIDTWAATAAGAFVLGENSLYTVEAWTTFLNHLSDQGLLSVSRWYFHSRPAELFRTTTIAVEALRRLGVSDPGVTSQSSGTCTLAPGARRRTALARSSSADVRSATTSSTRSIESSPARVRRAVQPARRARRDIRPPHPPDGLEEFLSSLSDQHRGADRRQSFLLQHAAAARPDPHVTARFRQPEPQHEGGGNARRPARHRDGPDDAVPAVAALGHPPPGAACRSRSVPGLLLRDRSRVHADRDRADAATDHCARPPDVRAVRRTLLAAAVERPRKLPDVECHSRTRGRGGPIAARRLVVVLAVFGLVTPAIVTRIEPMSTTARILAAVGILFPAGAFMGVAFPLGMKLAAGRTSGLTAWFWGLNGAASVLASVLGVCIALTWSISAAFWSGWTCYAAALGAFVWATRARG